MDHSLLSSSASGAGGAGQGAGRGAGPGAGPRSLAPEQARKRGAAQALAAPDRKRQMLASALQTGALDDSATVVIDDELLRDLLLVFEAREAQLPALLGDARLRQHLIDIARRGLVRQGSGGLAGPQPASAAWGLDLNAPEVIAAWESLCVLYPCLLASSASGAPTAMLMAARSLQRLPPNERRTERVVELLQACKRLMRDGAFVKGRAEVADACSIALGLLPAPEAPGAPGAQAMEPGAPEAWRVGDPMGNGTGVAPIAANGEWRLPAESYALSLLEAMFKDANVTLSLAGDGADWTDDACAAVLDAYLGKRLPEEVVLTDLVALARLLRGVVISHAVPFDRYLVWHDLLKGLRKRLGRQAEGAALVPQLAYWIRALAVHEKINRLPALVSRYLSLPVVSKADLPHREAALDLLRRLLGELEPGEVPGMPEVLEQVFAALDSWDMKNTGKKAQLLVRAARYFPQADPNDWRSRQTQLLNKALGYCLAETVPAPALEKALVARLVPDLMALPAAIRLAWLDRFFLAVGANLPPLNAVLGASASSALQGADIAQALNWVCAPSVPVVRAFATSPSALMLGVSPGQTAASRDTAADDGLRFQVAAAMWVQLVRHAPPSQFDAVAGGLAAWVTTVGGRQQDAAAWVMQMQPFVDGLGASLQRLPAPLAQDLIAAIARQVGALVMRVGPTVTWTAATGRWLLETLNAYQVALGRERVQDRVFLPHPPHVQRVFQAWPRLRVQRSVEFMAWLRQGPISMTPVELGRIRLDWGGFWAHALTHQARLVQGVMAPIRGRTA